MRNPEVSTSSTSESQRRNVVSTCHSIASRVDAEVAEVEEGVHVRSQQEAVVQAVLAGQAHRPDVRGLQRGLDVLTGDRAAALVGAQADRTVTSRLVQTSTWALLPEKPVPGTSVVIGEVKVEGSVGVAGRAGLAPGCATTEASPCSGARGPSDKPSTGSPRSGRKGFRRTDSPRGCRIRPWSFVDMMGGIPAGPDQGGSS